MVALLGPNKSAYISGMQEMIKNGGLPCICWGTSPVIAKSNTNPWLFFGRTVDTITAVNAATFMVKNLGCKNIGIFYNNDDYGKGCMDVLTKTITSLGAKYVAEGHNTGDKDFSGQLLKFKSSGCDAMTSWCHTAEVVIFARQRYEQGMTNIPYIGSVSVSESNASDLLDAAVLDKVYSVCDFSSDSTDPVISAVVKKCQEKFKYVPNVMYMAASSSLYAICNAIQKAGSTKPDAIKAALKAMDGTLKTSEGAIGCSDQQGLATISMVIQYDNAKKLHTRCTARIIEFQSLEPLI